MSLVAPAPFDRSFHLADAFDSGRPQLDTWLRAYAGQSQQRDAARTYVVAQPDGRVAGYYTLVAARIEHEEATAQVRRGMSKHFPIPAVLLARLAVGREFQGRGLGAALLADAMRRCVRVAGEVGIRAVVVDALDEQAAGFYRRFGFSSLTDDQLTLMATVSRLRRAGA